MDIQINFVTGLLFTEIYKKKWLVALVGPRSLNLLDFHHVKYCRPP